MAGRGGGAFSKFMEHKGQINRNTKKEALFGKQGEV